ncbi:MAG: glycosyltransferase family 2 protein [Nitrososphaeria archaeon]
MMTHLAGVDVIMLTKNSIKPCLKECLDSIYKNIPVNDLIIVDGGSVDGTTELLRQYPRVKILMDKNGNRATSRQLGVNEVKTDWFIFIDSDVILCEKWFEYVKKYLGISSIGAVWGAALQRATPYQVRYSTMARLYGKNEEWMAVKAGQRRGLTHDTIIRRKTIEGIRIPANLHVLEDHYIRTYIESRGYKWVATAKPFCYHIAHGRERPKDWYIFGQASKTLGLVKLKNIIAYALFGPYKSLLIYLNSRNLDAAKTQYLTYIYIIKGWLNTRRSQGA